MELDAQDILRATYTILAMTQTHIYQSSVMLSKCRIADGRYDLLE